jgi:hypothetical protein
MALVASPIPAASSQAPRTDLTHALVGRPANRPTSVRNPFRSPLILSPRRGVDFAGRPGLRQIFCAAVRPDPAQESRSRTGGHRVSEFQSTC